MRCTTTQKALSPYIDNELSSQERSRIDAHLAACQRCRERLVELLALSADVRAVPSITASADFDARVMAAIGRPVQRSVGWAERIAVGLERLFATPPRRALGTAAAGVLLAIVCVLPSTGVEFQVQSMGAAGTAPGSRLSVTVDRMLTTTDRIAPVEIESQTQFPPSNGG